MLSFYMKIVIHLTISLYTEERKGQLATKAVLA